MATASILSASSARGAAASRQWPHRLLVMSFAFSVPFLFLLPGFSERGISIAASDVLTLIACVVLLRKFLAGRLRLPFGMLCCLSAGALLLTQCVNFDYLIVARGAPVALAEIPKALLLWLHFYVAVNLIDTRQHFLLFVKSWIAGAVVVALLGIGGSIAFQAAGIENSYSNAFRAQGTMGDANLFAAHLGVSFILALFYARLTGRFPKWLISALLTFCAGILLSVSRGSTLSFLICLTLLWISISSWRTRLAIVGSFSLAALILMMHPPQPSGVDSNPITERLSTITFSLDNEGAADRKGLWESAWAEFRESPLVGVGRAGFTPLDEPELTKPSAIHNTYLSMACETGLIGFLLQMTFFVRCASGLLRAPMRDESLQLSRRMLVLGLVLIGLCGITISIENYRGLWVLLGMMEAHRRLYSQAAWQEAAWQGRWAA